MRKARDADVRGAGLWPTGVHEAPWNAAREVPHLLKRGFSSARRPEAMRTGVREPLENAGDEVPQPLLAALLYKIEKLGLSMHTDLHIDMSDVGLRRIE